MQVVLLERIEKLGQMGDVVKVKPGFARNYLLPRKKALRATAGNLKSFEEKRAQLEADNLRRRTEAEDMAGRMADLTIVLVRQAGEAANLYGSVSARDVADSVTEAGFTIDRHQVKLDRPIKSLGLHPVSVVLHPEVSVEITANVARSEEEARLQREKGSAVLSSDEQDEVDEEQEILSEDEALELDAEQADGVEASPDGADATPSG